MAAEVARPVNMCVSRGWRLSITSTLCERSAKAAGGSIGWGPEVKELHDEVLGTTGGVR